MTVHRFGDHRKPPATLPENDLNRGIALTHTLLARVIQEPPLVVTDADHIILAIRRLGDIASAYEFGQADIDGEVDDAIVSLLRWRLNRMRNDAA
jgi:hypothetical protein